MFAILEPSFFALQLRSEKRSPHECPLISFTSNNTAPCGCSYKMTTVT